MKHMAILTDVTAASAARSASPPARRPTTPARTPRTAGRRTPPTSPPRAGPRSSAAPQGRYVREQCRHCLDPACAAACPVGALQQDARGAGGLRRRHLHGLPLLHDGLPVPHAALRVGVGQRRASASASCATTRSSTASCKQPACTAACPTEATIFGDREELLAEARRRIAREPGPLRRSRLGRARGRRHVGALHLRRGPEPRPAGRPAWTTTPGRELARKVLHTVPLTFVGVAAGHVRRHWITERRQDVAAAEAPQAERAEPATTPTTRREKPVNSANNIRVVVTKAVLWFLVGVATAVAVARFAFGLGAHHRADRRRRPGACGSASTCWPAWRWPPAASSSPPRCTSSAWSATTHWCARRS